MWLLKYARIYDNTELQTFSGPLRFSMSFTKYARERGKENITWKLAVVNMCFVSRSISHSFTVSFIETFDIFSSDLYLMFLFLIHRFLDQEFDKGKALEENIEKLATERKRSEELLYRMMPKAIADRLRLGGRAVETCEVSSISKVSLK